MFIVLLHGEETASPHITFRVETVQFYGLVIVIDSLQCVTEEKITRSPVKICGRILWFLPYISVEIADGLVELLRKEMCDTTAEIQSHISGTEFNRLLKILQCLVIIAETAFRNASVMIAGSEYRIYGD